MFHFTTFCAYIKFPRHPQKLVMNADAGARSEQGISISLQSWLIQSFAIIKERNRMCHFSSNMDLSAVNVLQVAVDLDQDKIDLR